MESERNSNLRDPVWIAALICFGFVAGFAVAWKIFVPVSSIPAVRYLKESERSENASEPKVNHSSKLPDGSRMFIVDSDVPGTEIFLRNQRLGIAPLELTSAELQTLGLDEYSPDEGFWGDDGWGEGLFAGKEDERETKITLRVPDACASEFLSIETPWGARTKCGGLTWSASNPGAHVVTMFRRRRKSDGLELSLEIFKQPKLKDKSTQIRATLKNSGGQVVTGFRPALELFWGTFSTPWRRRTSLELNLGSEWSSIGTGESRTITLELPTPSVSEDYSLFGVFNLFSAAEGNHLLGDGSVYSDSKLLKVR